MRVLQNVILGALIGLISGYIIENYSVHTLNSFAFIWAAPILLFVPLYVSYYKGPSYARHFLSHAFLGSFLSVCVIIVTLILIHLNLYLALLVNFILSNSIIILYICYQTIRNT